MSLITGYSHDSVYLRCVVRTDAWNFAPLPVKDSLEVPMVRCSADHRLSGTDWPARTATQGEKSNMESQLVAGQWVEVSMEDLQIPVLLSGFVLSMRPSEVLLTFPELLAPPMGLESEAQATVRYNNRAGQFTAIGQIQRVAAGPPVTVTFKRLSARGSDPLSRPIRTAARLPVSVRVVTSSVTSSLGQHDMPGWTENLSLSGMLISTSLLLAVGDVLHLAVRYGVEGPVVNGRVIRVHECEDRAQARFGVGVEFVHADEGERKCWLAFLARFQGQERR